MIPQLDERIGRQTLVAQAAEIPHELDADPMVARPYELVDRERVALTASGNGALRRAASEASARKALPAYESAGVRR